MLKEILYCMVYVGADKRLSETMMVMEKTHEQEHVYRVADITSPSTRNIRGNRVNSDLV